MSAIYRFYFHIHNRSNYLKEFKEEADNEIEGSLLRERSSLRRDGLPIKEFTPISRIEL